MFFRPSYLLPDARGQVCLHGARPLAPRALWWHAAAARRDALEDGSAVAVLSGLDDAVAAERAAHLDQAGNARGGGKVLADQVLGAGRKDLVVQFVAVIRVLGHQVATVHPLK